MIPYQKPVSTQATTPCNHKDFNEALNVITNNHNKGGDRFCDPEGTVEMLPPREVPIEEIFNTQEIIDIVKNDFLDLIMEKFRNKFIDNSKDQEQRAAYLKNKYSNESLTLEEEELLKEYHHNQNMYGILDWLYEQRK